jgi:hypothetical protein
MAKVTIEFDSIEDNEELTMFINGIKWYSLAWEIDQYMRSRLKYSELSEEVHKELDAAREKLHEIMRHDGLKFD